MRIRDAFAVWRVTSCKLFGRCGPPTTNYNRFIRWAKAGVRVRVFEALAERSPGSMQLIDSSMIRAHQQAVPRIGGLFGSDPCIVA